MPTCSLSREIRLNFTCFVSLHYFRNIKPLPSMEVAGMQAQLIETRAADKQPGYVAADGGGSGGHAWHVRGHVRARRGTSGLAQRPPCARRRRRRTPRWPRRTRHGAQRPPPAHSLPLSLSLSSAAFLCHSLPSRCQRLPETMPAANITDVCQGGGDDKACVSL